MSTRRCPLCDAATDAPVCPNDRMATLLAGAPLSSALLPRPKEVIAGRYEIERLIGRGGHGQVFAGRHLGTGQAVALKILTPPADGEEELAVKRFFLEARATSSLAHPNTVRVYDFGQEDSGLLFLVLELLTGNTLRQELKVRQNEGRAFSEEEAIDIAVAITKSLGEAHAAGLVHRDLKPDNIFLHQIPGDEPVVKVLDFGIAKLGGGLHTLSTNTSVPGTPAYMSPEHALSGEVDARSDLYAVGVILYQLVTGELPFRGASDPQTLFMHAYQAPPDIRVQAKVPLGEAFVRVVQRALEKEPAKRFVDAREMREVLLAARNGVVADHLLLPAPQEAPRLLAPNEVVTPAETQRLPVVAPKRSRLEWVLAIVAFVIGAGIALALVDRKEPEPTVELVPAPDPPAPERPAPQTPAPVIAVKTATRAPEVVAVPSANDTKPVKRRAKAPAKREEDLLHKRLEDLVAP